MSISDGIVNRYRDLDKNLILFNAALKQQILKNKKSEIVRFHVIFVYPFKAITHNLFLP